MSDHTFPRPRKAYHTLMPMRIIEAVEEEYDKLAKEAVTAAVKQKCNKDIEINDVNDFTNALNDLRCAGYMIKFVVPEDNPKGVYRRRGEFKLYKIEGE